MPVTLIWFIVKIISRLSSSNGSSSTSKTSSILIILELIQRIKEEFPGIRILVLTTFYDDKSITDAITAGADGYLLKGSGKDAILSAINGIMGGQNVIEPKVMERMAALLKNYSFMATISLERSCIPVLS